MVGNDLQEGMRGNEGCRSMARQGQGEGESVAGWSEAEVRMQVGKQAGWTGKQEGRQMGMQ